MPSQGIQSTLGGIVAAVDLGDHRTHPRSSWSSRGELALGQHRGGQDHPVGRAPGPRENILLATEVSLQRHDDGFAQGIDGRIGDLGKLLPEIVVERAFLRDSTAIGVSSPMEPTASLPDSASGRSTWSRSSKLTWNIFMVGIELLRSIPGATSPPKVPSMYAGRSRSQRL